MSSVDGYRSGVVFKDNYFIMTARTSTTTQNVLESVSVDVRVCINKRCVLTHICSWPFFLVMACQAVCARTTQYACDVLTRVCLSACVFTEEGVGFPCDHYLELLKLVPLSLGDLP